MYSIKIRRLKAADGSVEDPLPPRGTKYDFLLVFSGD